MSILPRFALYRSLYFGSATSGESTPDLAYKLLSAKIYLRKRSTEITKMERKYSLQGFYRKNWRKNTRKEEAMLRLLVRRIGAEELTVGFSGGAAYLRCPVARQVLRPLRQRAAVWWRGVFSGRALRAGREERAREARMVM